LTIQLSKPVTFGHPGGFECGFADVDATWLWSPPVSPPLPLLSLSSILSPFSLSLFLLSSPSPSPSPVLCRGRGRRHRWPAMPDGQATPRQGRRPDQPAPATAPSHRLGHVSAMREPSRRAARGLAGHHDERCALHPAPSPTQLSPPSLASRRRLPLPSPLLFPPRAKPSSSRSPERRRCPLGCRGSSVRLASERGGQRG